MEPAKRGFLNPQAEPGNREEKRADKTGRNKPDKG